jgi:hypothetical protein
MVGRAGFTPGLDAVYNIKLFGVAAVGSIQVGEGPAAGRPGRKLGVTCQPSAGGRAFLPVS